MPSDLDELKELLERLQSISQPLSFSMLYGLSDLSGEQLTIFRTRWATFPTAQRRRLLQALVELAELNFEVHFEAIYRHCLDDADAEVRAMAVDGLWESEDIGLIGPLLTMLRADPSVQVRGAAASALGRYVLAGELEQLDARIQTRIITELLTTIHLVGESVTVRRRAIESTSYACTPEVLDALELAYYDEDEPMRISAIVGMGRSCDKRWSEIILQELESPSPAMRYEATWACGELGLREAVPVLARLINDPDRQVCSATIWALGQIGGPLAKQILVAAYDEADEDTQAALEDALAEQALLDGDLEFLLYELGSEPDGEPLDDEFVSLWTADDEEEDEFELNDWGNQDG
jgi:HEAT repeat protein